ncbi:MAG: hypothetical protein VST64_02165 [Nitrospirota bacterium]|nr:hypothetical protein [Nitrospirota bacterium]
MTKQASIWDRLAARTKPSGALAVIENPRTVVWMAFLWTLGAVPSAVLSAALFFWFDEPVSGWIYTGDDGQVAWSDLPGETATLTVSAQGYFTSEISETLDNKGKKRIKGS